MILAAAIKFHIDSTNQDVVLCGSRHHQIFKQLEPLGFEAGKGYKVIEQGFITDRGHFMDRYHAWYEAYACGQLKPAILCRNTKELFSEDLW